MCDSHPAPPTSVSFVQYRFWRCGWVLHLWKINISSDFVLTFLLFSKLRQKQWQSLFQSIAFHIYGSVATRIAVGWYVLCFTNCNWAHIGSLDTVSISSIFDVLQLPSPFKMPQMRVAPSLCQMVPQNWSLTLPKKKKKDKQLSHHKMSNARVYLEGNWCQTDWKGFDTVNHWGPSHLLWVFDTIL